MYAVLVYSHEPWRYGAGECFVCTMRACAGAVWVLAVHPWLLVGSVAQVGLALFVRLADSDDMGLGPNGAATTEEYALPLHQHRGHHGHHGHHGHKQRHHSERLERGRRDSPPSEDAPLFSDGGPNGHNGQSDHASAFLPRATKHASHHELCSSAAHCQDPDSATAQQYVAEAEGPMRELAIRRGPPVGATGAMGASGLQFQLATVGATRCALAAPSSSGKTVGSLSQAQLAQVVARESVDECNA